MTERQYEILYRFGEVIKPLDEKVKELEDFCRDGKKYAAPHVLEAYRKKLDKMTALRDMVAREFVD